MSSIALQCSSNTVEPGKPALDEKKLYLGDNGRCFCGALRCAGTTAYYTGKDLSGEPVVRVRRFDVAEFGVAWKCESCGKGWEP